MTNPFLLQQKFLQKMNERVHAVRDLDTSARMISYMQEKNLIAPQEKTRKRIFSSVEVLWMNLIGELWDYGFKAPELHKLKDKMIQKRDYPFVKDSTTSMNTYEKILFDSIVIKEPIWLLVSKECDFQIVEKNKLIDFLPLQQYGSCLFINLYKMVQNSVYKLLDEPELIDNSLTEQEEYILDLMRQDKYLEIKISRDNKDTLLIQSVENINNSKRVYEILAEGNYQDLLLKQRNGNVIKMTRTKRARFSESRVNHSTKK